MTTLRDNLSVEQQRRLHKLCSRFEDGLLSADPPGPEQWLAERGELPAAVVLREFLAIRAEFCPRGNPDGTRAVANDATLDGWRSECLQLLPDETNMVNSVFAEAEQSVGEPVAEASAELQLSLIHI